MVTPLIIQFPGVGDIPLGLGLLEIAMAFFEDEEWAMGIADEAVCVFFFWRLYFIIIQSLPRIPLGQWYEMYAMCYLHLTVRYSVLLSCVS